MRSFPLPYDKKKLAQAMVVLRTAAELLHEAGTAETVNYVTQLRWRIRAMRKDAWCGPLPRIKEIL